MFLYVCLILCYLSLAHLMHVPLCDDNEEILPLPKITNLNECNTQYLWIINNYFKRTTIVRSNRTEIDYCGTRGNSRSKRSPPSAPALDDINLTQLIMLYSALPFVVVYNVNKPNIPVTSYGVLPINDILELPLFIEADIRRRHLQISDTRPCIMTNLTEHMEYMGKMETDQLGHLLENSLCMGKMTDHLGQLLAHSLYMGKKETDHLRHLLAHSLGGCTTALNIVPMAKNLNQYHMGIEGSKELGIPRSYWRSNQDWIKRFLNNNPNGRVKWRIAVQYKGDTIINPSNSRNNFRPVRFALQFTAYSDQDDPTSVIFDSSEISFYNDNVYACGYEEHRRSIEFVQENLPICKIPYPFSPKIKMGEETDHGEWGTRHKVSFPFKIGKKQYFYGQSILDGRHWFIQELLPHGRMGEETDHGTWGYNYPVVFPFHINGRQFFYGHSTESKLWFIQELLQDGKMGDETDHGRWGTRHQVSFPFKIGKKQYFYGQSILDGRHWFIQELLPNGRMGEETDNGRWDNNYPLVFPFHINGRQFFYGHSTESKIWFIQELLQDGKMGEETEHGRWGTRHQVSFPFKNGGNQYFYGQSILDGKHWFIQELLPNGRMGEEADHGMWGYNYPVVFPFHINGRQFFYGHSTENKIWFIQSLNR